MSRVMGNAPATDLPGLPEPPDESHNHRWVAVGIYDYQIDTDSMMGKLRKGVAQSCECGEVRGIPLLTYREVE